MQRRFQKKNLIQLTACLIANDIFKYMYNLADKDSILTGIASTDTSDTSND